MRTRLPSYNTSILCVYDVYLCVYNKYYERSTCVNVYTILYCYYYNIVMRYVMETRHLCVCVCVSVHSKLPFDSGR